MLEIPGWRTLMSRYSAVFAATGPPEDVILEVIADEAFFSRGRMSACIICVRYA